MAPDRVSPIWKVCLRIRGITASYICQKVQMDKKAIPTKTVRLVFNFINLYLFPESGNYVGIVYHIPGIIAIYRCKILINCSIRLPFFKKKGTMSAGNNFIFYPEAPGLERLPRIFPKK